MTISFNSNAGLAPHHYIEIDNTGAFEGLSTQPQRLLLITYDEPPHPKARKSGEDVVPPPLPPAEAEQKPDLPRGETKHFSLLKNYVLPADLERAIKTIKDAAPRVEYYVLVLTKESVVSDDNARAALDAVPEISFSQFAILKHNDILLKALKIKLALLWGSDIQLDGHVFVAKYGTILELKEEATKRNDAHLTILPLRDLQDDPASWVAGFAAVVANEAFDPARPHQTLVVRGITTNSPEGFKLSERDVLLDSGVATWKKNGEAIVMDRLVTTYTKNDAGAVDPSYRDLNTMQTLSYLRYDIHQGLLSDFPRHKLALDDFPYKGPVVTPKILKMWLIARYRKQQASMEIVQDPDGNFSKTVKVEGSESQPGKVDGSIRPHLMGQYVQTQFKLAFKI